ncbi:MAG: zf-TFIIB domain-containing protein [Myxococcota bacterium]
MKQCPVCGEMMKTEKRGEVEVDVCEKHGMWLDRKELLLLTEQARYEDGRFVWQDLFRTPKYVETDRERILFCPISGEQMQLVDYKGVTIDWSPEHGVWLDNGELEAIINNLRLDPRYIRGVALRLSETRF